MLGCLSKVPVLYTSHSTESKHVKLEISVWLQDYNPAGIMEMC